MTGSSPTGRSKSDRAKNAQAVLDALLYVYHEDPCAICHRGTGASLANGIHWTVWRRRTGDFSVEQCTGCGVFWVMGVGYCKDKEGTVRLDEDDIKTAKSEVRLRSPDDLPRL